MPDLSEIQGLEEFKDKLAAGCPRVPDFSAGSFSMVKPWPIT